MERLWHSVGEARIFFGLFTICLVSVDARPLGNYPRVANETRGLSQHAASYSVSSRQKIDVHHHYVPDFFPEEFIKAGGDPTGYALPTWSLELDRNFSKEHGITTRIFSLSSPGITLFPNFTRTALVVRKVNEYGAALRDSDPSKIGFFAALPSLLDKDVALAEICHAYDVLKADGIGLYTRYGNDRNEGYYLGHRNFTEIWDELDRRKAVVFIHPTYEPLPFTRIEDDIAPSTLDFPQETTRTAVDLIVTDTLKNHPNVKIILSHAGGTLPYIAGRVATHLYYSGRITKTPDEFLADAKRFYYDTATSGNPYTLSLIDEFALESNILFGTDFPFGPEKAISTSVQNIEAFQWQQTTAEKVSRDNALNLFPRLKSFSV